MYINSLNDDRQRQSDFSNSDEQILPKWMSVWKDLNPLDTVFL